MLRVLGGVGVSSLTHKTYARQMKDFEVYSVQEPSKSSKCETQIIGFSDNDYKGVSLPHRTTLNELKAITLTPHLSMKFPTEEGIGVQKGDRRMAREC